jgi:hypothetical protein
LNNTTRTGAPSSESRYLIQCIQSYVTGRATPPVAPDDIDWARFLTALEAHQLITTLATGILETIDLPSELGDRLRDLVLTQRRRCGLFQLELVRVASSLEASGIPCIALKGSALGKTVYRSSQDRFLVDLDLLAPATLVNAALEALKDLGYKVAETTRHLQFYREYHFHLVLQNAGGITVELHWDLSKPDDYFRFDTGRFALRARRLEDGNRSLTIPSNEDQILHAAAQSTIGGYSDVRRLVDAALLTRHGDLDYQLLVELARECRLSTSVWLLLILAEEIAAAQFDDRMIESLGPATSVRACIDSLDLPERIISGAVRDQAGTRKLVAWLCCPSFRVGLEEARRFVFPGRPQFLADGYDPSNLPGFIERLQTTLWHTWYVMRICGYQSWRLLRSALRVGPKGMV